MVATGIIFIDILRIITFFFYKYDYACCSCSCSCSSSSSSRRRRRRRLSSMIVILVIIRRACFLLIMFPCCSPPPFAFLICLIFCFSAVLPLHFPASPLFCFSPFLLLCFSAAPFLLFVFCFSAFFFVFLCFCFRLFAFCFCFSAPLLRIRDSTFNMLQTLCNQPNSTSIVRQNTKRDEIQHHTTNREKTMPNNRTSAFVFCYSWGGAMPCPPKASPYCFNFALTEETTCWTHSLYISVPFFLFAVSEP